MRDSIKETARVHVANYGRDELDLDVLASALRVSRKYLQQFFTSPRAIEMALLEDSGPLADDDLYQLLFEGEVEALISSPGIQHVAVAVSDLDRSAMWYSRLFGVRSVLGSDVEDGLPHRTVVALEEGTLVDLYLYVGRESRDQADSTRAVPDHVRFGLPGTRHLERWRARLDRLGIPHSGIEDGPRGPVVSVRDPDDIVVEFVIDPGA